MQGSPWELVSAQEKSWWSPQEEEPSCFLMITRMGATLESDYLGWPVTQSGFRKKELRKVPSAGVGKTQALPLSPLLSLNAPCCWLDSPHHTYSWTHPEVAVCLTLMSPGEVLCPF